MAFDPFGWLGRSGRREIWDSESWLDAWARATTWWVDPSRWTSLGGPPPSPERVLFELIEGVARRFAGRRLQITRHGHAVSLVLDGLRVERRAGVSVHVEAHDVEWGGIGLDEISAVAKDVTFSPGLSAQLSATGVDVTANTSFVDLVPWLQRFVEDTWSLEAVDTGKVVARARDRPLALVVDPSLADGRIHFELREVSWRGLRVPVPGWLRLTRSRPVPELPGGIELVDAWRRQDVVTLRLRLPAFSQTLDLGQLRRAVVGGDPALAFAG